MEEMTDRMEAQAEDYFRQIDEIGGVIPAIEAGFFQREIAQAAYDYQQAVDSGRRIIVGVNEFVHANEELEIPILQINPEAENLQREKLRSLRARRNDAAVQQALGVLQETCRSDQNIMPAVIDAAKAEAEAATSTTRILETSPLASGRSPERRGFRPRSVGTGRRR